MQETEDSSEVENSRESGELTAPEHKVSWGDSWVFLVPLGGGGGGGVKVW